MDNLINQLSKVHEKLNGGNSLQDRIDMLEEAREHLQDAYDLVREAIEDTSIEANVEAYFLDHLKIMTTEEHGFLSSDQNIDSIIEMLRDEDEEEDEEETPAEEPKEAKEVKEEKPKFEPGEKVRNHFGEVLTVVKKDGNQVWVEEQPNLWYHPTKLFKVKLGECDMSSGPAAITHVPLKKREVQK